MRHHLLFFALVSCFSASTAQSATFSLFSSIGQAAYHPNLTSYGDNFTLVVNNDQSTLTLAFTGTSVFYIINGTLPASTLGSINENGGNDFSALQAQTLRVKITDLNSSISSAETISGGAVITNNGVDRIYLFGNSTIYVVTGSLQNLSAALVPVPSGGLVGAVTSSYHNGILYIPQRRANSTGQTNLYLFDTASNSISQTFTTIFSSGVSDSFYRISEDILILQGISNSGFYPQWSFVYPNNGTSAVSIVEDRDATVVAISRVS